MIMDSSCAATAILFFTSNILNILVRSRNFRHQDNIKFSFEDWKALDANYLKEQWSHRISTQNLNTAAGILNAIAWFSLCIPILQLAWILSRGGKRHLGTHILIGGLVVAGSILETVARLMIIGISSATSWMAKDFNVDSWMSVDDGIGWRVLEMIHIASYGLIIWIDAFEWLALSAILILIYASVDSDNYHAKVFTRKWSIFGLVIAFLCWFDFVADVMRMASWRFFMQVAFSISILNTLILFPVWLIILGKKLPLAKCVFDDRSAVGSEEIIVGEEEHQELELS